MAFIVRRSENSFSEPAPGVRRRGVIDPGLLPDDRLRVKVLEMEPGASWTVTTEPRSLVWLQVLTGAVTIDGERRDHGWVVMAARGHELTMVAEELTSILVCHAPNAADYDPDLSPDARADVDWSREPVLSSEHDTRQRIYLASPSLWGTDAVKGEMIIYPPGSSGAAHHHEGAEHFQFIVSGSGTADLAGVEHELHAGDLLYNLEHEVHAFYNATDADMVFVEYFVPGRNTTVWVPGANACAWNPTGSDIEGRTPVREIPSHVHGAIEV
jgi:quercetin dioxygenase-like cupin family protein